MGQGTESCNGYELEYDSYEEGLQTGEWTMRGCSTIHISDMTMSHLRKTKRMCENLRHNSSFYDEADKWDMWVSMLSQEISSRQSIIINSSKKIPTATTLKQTKQKVRGAKIECKCKNCKTKFIARVADRKRGWAKFCSKSCKAINQMKKKQ